MPSTPTTTATAAALPLLLDLLAAPAADARGGKGSGAFDALLQPTPTQPASDSVAGTSGRSEARPQQETPRGARQQTAVRGPTDDTSGRQSRANSTDPPDLQPSEKPSGETPSDDSEPGTDSSVLAESLAGLPASIAPAVADPLVVKNDAPVASEPAAAKQHRGQHSHSDVAQQTASSISQAGQNGETQPAAAIADSGLADESQNLALVAGHEADAKSPLLADARQSADAAGREHPAGGAREVSAMASAVLEAQPASSNDTGQQREEKSFDQQLDLATSADSQSAELLPPPDLQSLTIDVLPAAVVPPPQAALAQHQAASASALSGGSAAIDPTGAARRARLPGEVVARDTSRAARHSGPNVDATRLLGRVARAFAAAQQRDGEIQLRLSPPELGSLKLTVHMQEGGLAARLETETTAAKTALLDNLPALRERLAEQGLRIERFDVDLMQRQPGGTPDRSNDQQRNTSPTPRVDPVARQRTESTSALRPIPAASSSHSGLNVIV